MSTSCTCMKSLLSVSVMVYMCLQMTTSATDPFCCHHNKTLPIPLYTHQSAYFHSTHKLFIFGGITVGDVHSSSIYRWNTNIESKWFEKIIATTPSTQFYSMTSNVVVINDRMAYFIGINDGSYTSAKIYIFDSIKEEFIDNNLPQLPFPAISGCLTTNNSHIFMVGGYNDSSATAIHYIQIYDIAGYQWHYEQIDNELPVNTLSMQYCSMINNVIYLFGGNDRFHNYSNKYYSYNTLTKEWKYLGVKSIGSSAGAAVYNYPYIYLIGGWSGSVRLNNIDQFDITNEEMTNSNTLTMVDSLSGLTASIIHSKIYIFGGRNSSFEEVALVQMCGAINTLSPTRETSVSPTDRSGPKTVAVVFITLGCIVASICVVTMSVLCYYSKRQRDDDFVLLVDNDNEDEGGGTQYIG